MSESRKMAKRGALFVEVDGRLHQVMVKHRELMTVLMELAATMHDGVLPVFEHPVEGISLPPIEATNRSPKETEDGDAGTRGNK